MTRRSLTIVSGGQTGVDRAAMDAALARGLAVGGYCPKGRWAEDGPIPERYPLMETASGAPAERTRLNVDMSDGTLILTAGPPDAGTRLAIERCDERSKPHFIADLENEGASNGARNWIEGAGIRSLNIAGPRESHAPGIYGRALAFCTDLFEKIAP